MIYIDEYQKYKLALIIKYTFIIVSRAPIPTLTPVERQEIFGKGSMITCIFKQSY